MIDMIKISTTTKKMQKKKKRLFVCKHLKSLKNQVQSFPFVTGSDEIHSSTTDPGVSSVTLAALYRAI